MEWIAEDIREVARVNSLEGCVDIFKKYLSELREGKDSSLGVCLLCSEQLPQGMLPAQCTSDQKLGLRSSYNILAKGETVSELEVSQH